MDIIFDQISAYYLEYRKTNPPKMKYQTQYSIFLKLKQLAEGEGVEILNEATVDPHKLIFCDIVLPKEKIVCEVDGPYHFLFGDRKKRVETDKMNRLIIEKLGWKVRSVDVEEYNEMDPGRKEQFLKSLIK